MNDDRHRSIISEHYLLLFIKNIEIFMFFFLLKDITGYFFKILFETANNS